MGYHFRKLRLCSLLLLCLIAACGRSADSNLFAIIGQDDSKKVITPKGYEEAVGTLTWQNSPICTAFAISPNTIITAAHCYDDVAATKSPFMFRSSQGTFGVMQPKYSQNLDILKLTLYEMDAVTFRDRVPLSTDRDFLRPLLKTYLPFPSKQDREEFKKNEASTNRDFELLSHSGIDFELKRQVLPSRGVKVAGFLLHEFDTVPGTSGSPILMGNKVVGIHVGTLKSHNFNIAVPIETYIADQKHKEECEASIFTRENVEINQTSCEPLYEISLFLYDVECDPQIQSCRNPPPQTPKDGYDPDFPSDSPDPTHNDRAHGSGDRDRDRFSDWMGERKQNGQDPKSDPRWRDYAATIGTVLVDISIEAAITVATKRYMPGTGSMIRAVGASGMNRLLKKAGKEITKAIKRFDKGNTNTKTQDHVHFKDGTSSNIDGSVHDKHNGIPQPTREVKDWLKANGWSIPD